MMICSWACYSALATMLSLEDTAETLKTFILKQMQIMKSGFNIFQAIAFSQQQL